jgi:hypothetical protein
MDSSSDQFRKLKGLLRWKQHEQPPPGFFLDFSYKVIARIEAAQRAPQPPCWQRLWAEIDPKPVLVSSYGVAVCAFMLFGLSLSQSTSDGGPGTVDPTGTPLMTVTSMVSGSEPVQVESPKALDLNRAPSERRISSMHPVTNTESPIAVSDRFGQSQPQIQLINYSR